MSDAITLVNQSIYPAIYYLSQGPDTSTAQQMAVIGVPPSGQAVIPTGNSYTVTATTDVNGITVTSNTLSFEEDEATILAQVMMTAPNLYTFQIIQLPATQDDSINLQNTWREDVYFNITLDGSPMACVLVVDGHNSDSVSTLQQYWIYSITNGITTEPVGTDDPNATATLTQDNVDDGFSLAVQ